MTTTAGLLRSKLIDIGEALDYELVYKELLRFLPASTLEMFLDHLTDVAEIDDLL
jgi:hypothetical protein